MRRVTRRVRAHLRLLLGRWGPGGMSQGSGLRGRLLDRVVALCEPTVALSTRCRCRI